MSSMYSPPTAIDLGKRMPRYCTVFLKWTISLLLLGYLAFELRSESVMERFWNCHKDWSLLVLGYGLCLVSVLTTIVRWHILLRSVQVPVGRMEVLRLGLFSYFLNLVSIGNIGGDLGRAVLVTRRRPGLRTQAVASVVVDRVIGLYALFLVASVAVLLSGFLQVPDRSMRIITRFTLLVTAASTIAFVVLIWFLTKYGDATSARLVGRFPRIESSIRKLHLAVRCYRDRPGVLFVALLMSIALRVTTTFGVYLIGEAIAAPAPTLGSQFVVVPLGIVAGCLPLPLNGLGAFEAIMEYLYRQLPGAVVQPGQGLLVAVGFRGVMVLTGVVGVLFWTLGSEGRARHSGPAGSADIRDPLRRRRSRRQLTAGTVKVSSSVGVGS